MPNKTTAQAQADAQRHLDHFDKWLHKAVLLSFVALEHGAPKAEVDAILQANKEETDRRLIEKMRQAE